MRRWWIAATASARLASEWPELWLPGALAWTVGVGWIPLVLAVARPPTVAELTFLGAGFVTSGAWPWNLAALAGAAVVVVLLAATLHAAAEATIVAALAGGDPAVRDVGRLLAIREVTSLPAVIALAAMLPALVIVAPQQFNAPDPAGGPVMATAVRLAPFILLALAALCIAIGVTPVASRLVVAGRSDIGGALRGTPGAIRRLGGSWVAQVAVSIAIQLAFLALSVLLLAVLWAPIGAQLGRGASPDLGTGLLLVGFVAIWLCLVLGGGALHAWAGATWSRLLASDTAPSHVSRT